MASPGPSNQAGLPSPVLADDSVGASAQRKASIRLLPIIAIGYGLAYMDRINISFASLRMNSDLHFSATVYGLGAGLFFIGYALCEVPSNLLMLRFGPRRWLARIMFTWGLLAVAMMFVRTPFQFYSVRLLLGIAEAGFFPGVVYYLTLWFPARTRARAISRFYIAFPLSSVIMGSLAGWLMGLDGTLSLAGWQWLFLLEGMPAVLFSFVILRMLPDSPDQAQWLTNPEKSWLRQQLETDAQQAHLGHGAGVLRALLSLKVWMIGGFFFFALLCGYAFNFSAPAILQAATGWNVAQVGYLVAAFGVAGALSMLINSAHSDETGERAMHCIVPCLVMGAAFLVGGSTQVPWLVVLSWNQLCCLHIHSLPRGIYSHPVSRWTRGSRWYCSDEHHHHVQWFRRSLHDGSDERRDRKLSGGLAGIADTQPGCRWCHVRSRTQPGAAESRCTLFRPGQRNCVRPRT